MKILIFILNIYIFSLSLLPCEDERNDNVSSSGDQITLSTASKATHLDDECAPFCTCTCCSVFKTIPNQIIDKAQLQLLSAGVFCRLPGAAPREIMRTVWQPPQLG